MNKSSKMVLNKCCEDLKKIKHLLSAISDEEVEALKGTKNWNSIAQLKDNSYKLNGAVTDIYKAVGKLNHMR